MAAKDAAGGVLGEMKEIAFEIERLINFKDDHKEKAKDAQKEIDKLQKELIRLAKDDPNQTLLD